MSLVVGGYGAVGAVFWHLWSLLLEVGTRSVYAQSTANASGVGGNTQQLQDALCGTGIGPLLGIVLLLIALYLLVKALFRGMIAFDKMGSSRTEDVRTGRQQLRGSVMTILGAMVPGIFLAVMEIIGYPTVSCISENVQVLWLVAV
jgi:hypothetical protein